MGKNFCNAGAKWCKFCRRGNCEFSNTPTESITGCPRIEAISTVQLADLLKQTDFDSVFPRLLHYYPEEERSREGYREVFETIRTLTPKPMTKLDELFISVIIEPGTVDGKESPNVSGIQLQNKDKLYGIEFRKWSDWISMHVLQETLDTLPKEDIVACCLYEMTFYGFSEQQVQTKADTLMGCIE